MKTKNSYVLLRAGVHENEPGSRFWFDTTMEIFVLYDTAIHDGSWLSVSYCHRFAVVLEPPPTRHERRAEDG